MPPPEAVVIAPRRLRWSAIDVAASGSVSGSQVHTDDKSTLPPPRLWHTSLETPPSLDFAAPTRPPSPLIPGPAAAPPRETNPPSIALPLEQSVAPPRPPTSVNDSDLISPAIATTVSPVTQQPKAVSAIKTPDRETSTTAVASDTHDSYARLLVSLIVLGVVVIAMIAIVGVVMEIRRRKQQKNAQADDEYFYDEAEDVLDGNDISQSWTFDSDRTPRAYL